MNIFTFLLFITVAACLGDVNAKNLSSADMFPADSIVVAGRIIEISENGSKTILINECDPSDKSERRLIEPDSSGRFRASIPFSFGHTFTINYNRKFINVYAEPGDSIFIQIDASESPLEFHLSGSHESLNNQYAHACDALYRIYNDVALPSDTVPLAEYLAAFKSEVARTRSVVDEYIGSNALSSEAAKLLYTDNLFSIANHAISYKGIDRKERLSFFTDSIFDIYNEENARLMIFPYHLKALLFSFPEYVDSVPKGLIRDLMYASLHEDGITVGRSAFANPAYHDRIYADNDIRFDLNAITSADLIVSQEDTVYNIKAKNPLKWLTREFPGKIIYLDISATWCGPCRMALANSKVFREYFKDSDVVFAVIWLKSDLKSWAKLVPSITDAVNILILDDDTANRIMATLKIKGFPSSYLIDRNGTVIHKDVPSIDSAALPDFLKSKL